MISILGQLLWRIFEHWAQFLVGIGLLIVFAWLRMFAEQLSDILRALSAILAALRNIGPGAGPRSARQRERPATARGAGDRPRSTPDMMLGRMMGAGRAPSALPKDRLTVLYAMMTLLDPENGDEIERIAASLSCDDVAQAIFGLKELIDTLVAMTPIEEAVAEAIEDLQRRETALAERKARIVKRENVLKHALEGF